MKPPHKKDVGKRRLKKFIDGGTETNPRLPLIHTTDTYNLVDIIDSGLLKSAPCEVFSPESLVYLFYGRPSFRPNSQVEPLSLNHYFPICLIFDTELKTQIRRILPFDSGAYELNLYRPYLHQKMMLGDFWLEPDPSTPGKVIDRFFPDNESYLKGQPHPSVDEDPSQFEIHTLSAIYNAKDSNAMDSRNSSIEIQVDDDIDVNAHLRAVVMPEEFEKSDVGKLLRSKGKTVLPYPIFGRSSPTEYMGTIHQMVLSYYSQIAT